MAEEEILHAEKGEESEQARALTDEWTAAALAHASILLSVILSGAGGVGGLAGAIVPLAIYLGYRDRSRYVAFHALQALIYQLAGLLLGVPVYVALAVSLITAVVVAWVASGLLAAVLIGFLLMPAALGLTLLATIVLAGAPVAWVGYGLYGAYQVYQGRGFRYVWIGELLEREVGR